MFVILKHNIVSNGYIIKYADRWETPDIDFTPSC